MDILFKRLDDVCPVVSVHEIVQLFGEREARGDHRLPLANAFFVAHIEEIVSIWNLAVRQSRNELIGRRNHHDIVECVGAGATPFERFVEPAGDDSIEKMSEEDETLLMAELEIEVVVDDATVEEQAGNVRRLMDASHEKRDRPAGE